jgi:sugar O-acyltransferase (sialic acid O-acetyltransferase NeuD family)
MPAQPSTLVIIGAGGHGRVVADAALAMKQWQRVVATDRNATRCAGELVPGVPLMPFDQALQLPAAQVHVAIGSAEGREREASLVQDRLATVIHPRASVSPAAVLAPGCFVAAQAVVAPGARVGACAIVNHGAVVDHDVQVGDYSHVAPLSAIGGEAGVGAGVLVGAGSVVLPQRRVADHVVLGAGAVVRADIVEAGVYAGVPAQRVR